jgi:hypothetical protein
MERPVDWGESNKEFVMRFVLTRFALAAATAAFLASCGGGGGGGGGSVPSIETGPQPVTITVANAKPVAADALDSVRNTSSTNGPAGLPMAASTPAMLTAAQLATAAPRTGSMPMGVMATHTLACPLGGTMTLSGNFATTTGTSPGDNFTIATASCAVDEGGVMAVMNGQMSITIVSGSMDTMPFHAVLQVTVSNLSVASAGTTTVTSGDMRLDWNAMTTMSQTMTSSGASLNLRETFGSTTRSSTMTNYTQAVSLNGNTVSSTLAATIQTNNAHFAGVGSVTYVVSTPAPVVWDAATDVVASGSVKVVGAANSQLTLNLAGAGNASIALDANGDGMAELTTPTTVAELESLR